MLPLENLTTVIVIPGLTSLSNENDVIFLFTDVLLFSSFTITIHNFETKIPYNRVATQAWSWNCRMFL